MEKPSKYREVNQVLGKNPRLGPLTIAQALVFSVILLLAYILKQGLNLTWVQTFLFCGWAVGSYLMLFGDRHWRYTNKFTTTPYFIRGYLRYKSLKFKTNEGKKRKKTN